MCECGIARKLQHLSNHSQLKAQRLQLALFDDVLNAVIALLWALISEMA